MSDGQSPVGAILRDALCQSADTKHDVLMTQAEQWLAELHDRLTGCASRTDGDPIAFRLAAMEVRNAIGQLKQRAECLRQFSKTTEGE